MKYIFLSLGLFLLTFPLIGEQQSKAHSEEVIEQYQKVIESMEQSQCKMMMDTAIDYKSESDYMQKLNPLGNGVMGWIEIPKIECMLPIFHGTDETILEKGVGHLYGSDFPIGGINTHSLLCGHRGLPGADLFLDLDELQIGDYFYINVCGVRLTYQVCSVYTIGQNEINKIRYDEGKDMISLVTCTPYGINTRRLIVSGERR